MSSVTKLDLAIAIADKLGIQQSRAREWVDGFFDTLRETLVSGHDVHISGFGNFMLREKSARPGRNPMTGEEVVISPRRVVSFRLGQKLKARMQDA